MSKVEDGCCGGEIASLPWYSLAKLAQMGRALQVKPRIAKRELRNETTMVMLSFIIG